MSKTTKTEYFYNNEGELDRVVTTETGDRCPCDECEDGELFTSEVEFVDESSTTLATTALVLATVGLCLTAVSAILNRK